METQNTKGRSQTPPQGYFESFESNLLQRMEMEGINTNAPNKSKMKISWMRLSAAAAAVVVMLTIGFLVLKKSPDQTVVKINPKTSIDSNIMNPTPAVVEKAKENEALIIAAITEEVNLPETKVAATPPKTKEDVDLEKELEELGLISGDSGEEILGEMDIQPN